MNWRKWLDEFVLAGKGILLATKEKKFWYGFVPSFIFFSMLMDLLSLGTTKFQLLFSGNWQILWDSFLAVFGVGRIFVEWLPTFAIAVLQGILIGIIVLLWNKKRDSKNAENVEKAGIIAGLIAFGAGCPTCGVSLVAPLLGAIFGTGSAVIGMVPPVVTALAVIIAILSLKRLGEEVYVIIINERYLAKHNDKVEKVKKEKK